VIIDLIFSVLFVAARGFLDLLPSWTAPAFLGSLDGYATTVGGYASGVAYWVPFDTAGTVVAGCAALYGIVTGARLALWLWAKLPFVGK